MKNHDWWVGVGVGVGGVGNNKWSVEEMQASEQTISITSLRIPTPSLSARFSAEFYCLKS